MFKMSLYGPVLPTRNWVPAPRYILRRKRILRHLTGYTPGKVLEVGSGAGALLVDLAQANYVCTGYEISQAAREVAAEFIRDSHTITLCSEARSNWVAHFDYLMAFEVLEHIEDDYAALSEWLNWLRPNGMALFSVPAHKRRWTASDVWVGHCRRYDKADLVRLCEQSGLEVLVVEHYGFPIANLVEIFRTRYHARRLQALESQQISMTRDEHNLQSGVERTAETKLYKYMDTPPIRMLFRVGFWLQHLTRNLPLGNGLLIIARKK